MKILSWVALLVVLPVAAAAQGKPPAKLKLPAGAKAGSLSAAKPAEPPPQTTPALPTQPSPAPAAPAGTADAPAAPAQPPPSAGAENWSYDAEDRRDPFLSLLGRGNDPRDNTSRPPGLPGLAISDVTVKGIVRDRGGFIAMLQGPDGKTHIVRAGDRLFDGSVKSIVVDKVIFSQDVNDPLSLVKQREIPKAVRPTEARGGAAE